MTLRAVLLGLAAGAAVCGLTYTNDFILRQTFLVGNYMPISVYGGLLLFLLVVNPLLLWSSKRLALKGKELAVIVALTLAACYVPGRGLMHYFSTFLMMPHHYIRTDPGWKEQRIVEMAPRRMLAGVGPLLREEHILDLQKLCSKLAAEEDRRSPGPTRRVWELLPEEARATVQAIVKDASRKAAMVEALGACLANPDFYRAGDYDEDKLPGGTKKLLERRASLTEEETKRLNRLLLESSEPEGLAVGRAGSAPLGVSDILDWRAFCSGLVREGRAQRPGPLARLWALMSSEARDAARATLEAEGASARRCREIVAALNALIEMPGFYREEDFAGLELPREGAELLERLPQRSQRAGTPETSLSSVAKPSLSGEDIQRLNRHLLDSACPQEIMSLGRAMESCVNAFVLGLGERAGRSRWERFQQIPWYAWGRTFLFWIPLLLAISVAMIGLALVVHRQWSDHEQLPYPIVKFAHALLPEEGEARGGVFRNRLFWLGACFVLAIHMNNYSQVWWPEYLVRVPNRFDFRKLAPLFPTLVRGGGEGLLWPTFYFTAIGFAYFLATDVSLSLGLAPFVYALAAGIFAGYGISFTGGGFIALNIQKSLFAGAYLGFFLVLLYTGRRYFMSVFRRCFGLSASDEVEPHAVWGARVFLIGSALFVLQLVVVGLELYLAILYTLGTVAIFLVISRVVAETGVFFIHSYFFPCIMIWWFLGARAVGPEALLIMFMVTCLLLIDPRESVMPFMVLGLKLVDMSKVKLGKTAAWGAGALVLGFAVAGIVTLYIQHDQGVTKVSDGWTRNVPKFGFNATVGMKHKLKAQGNLEEAGKLTGTAWLRSISPNVPALVGFSVSMTLVLLFTACRLRFPRWPLHPVLFLVLGTFQSRTLAASFMLGWFIKVMVLRFGGARSIDKLKPLMIGLIAGDMVGGVVPMIIGAVIYSITGEPPPGGFKVLPS